MRQAHGGLQDNRGGQDHEDLWGSLGTLDPRDLRDPQDRQDLLEDRVVRDL